MIEIKRILKKDITSILENKDFFNNEFLPISRHRLYAHSKNPNSSEEDTVLLLAYLNKELVGYMGVFIDTIKLNNVLQKIGWLSTWWVHPKTKGTGIGRRILEEMYSINNGSIGISQFTESAKRVYDKSGYFETLKENVGVKAVLRSNLVFIVPILAPKIKIPKKLLEITDSFINVFLNFKLFFQKRNIVKNIGNVQVEYVNKIDLETENFIDKNSNDHISPKGKFFFEWLKSCHWVQDAPLIEYTEKERYAFSMYDKSFDIYLVNIIKDQSLLGFIVLQKRDVTLKVLFSYYDHNNTQVSDLISEIIKLQCIRQNIREIICYDSGICKNLNASNIFVYKSKKIKQSIISKVFEKTDFSDVQMNFGDGDCSFA